MDGIQQKNGESPAEILIIEDSPTQIEQLRYILVKNGYRVVTAGNGQEALALLRTQVPTLIISDIVMPEMDGYELCQAIKGDSVIGDVPVILLTALSDPHDVIKGLACGADSFITKPYREEYLLARINYLLTNRSLRRESAGGAGTEVIFDGQRYVITADRRQVLDLLLSTYETAIQKNNELLKARDELKDLNEQLAEANQELEAFNYTVSHDLRSPVTTIYSCSQMLLEMYHDRLDPDCREYIDDIMQESQRMDQLIKTLLNFSRLARSDINPQPLELSEIARSIAASLQRKEPQRTVHFQIASEIPAEGDLRLLWIVLENLLGNAWKYTGRKEKAVIEFGMQNTAGGPIYYLRDNGAGFEMSQAERLFAPFQRLHGGEEFKGHGIGLATVQRIISRHGGRIWAEGEPDKGATFYFTLA